ncbi:hypothetical protein [Chromobacterium sp. LK1]|uniref:hypothetical protein n=1 Tax=Chromobacterium sp. LK1 TaxID=1628193 RepID=UPI000B0DA9F7|nr:hypothetical protein [Chromobacterium sp. LK1]
MLLARFCALLLCFCFGTTFAQDKVDYGAMLNRLKYGCSNYKEMLNYQNLIELNHGNLKKGISLDFAQYMAFDGLDWIPLVKEVSCKKALLENEIKGIGYYIKHQPVSAYMYNDAKLKLAQTLMIQALLSDGSDTNATFKEADTLVRDYLQNDKDEFKHGKSMAYYFSAHAYIDSSEYANKVEERLLLLDKAINSAKAGLKKAKDRSSILEPLGIALGKKGQLLSISSSERKETLMESIEAFKLGDLSDKINLYNIATSYIQIGDIENAKLWLLKIEALKKIDSQTCIQGLMLDPDIEPLRTKQKDWFVGYMQRNCLDQIKAVMMDSNKP